MEESWDNVAQWGEWVDNRGNNVRTMMEQWKKDEEMMGAQWGNEEGHNGRNNGRDNGGYRRSTMWETMHGHWGEQ